MKRRILALLPIILAIVVLFTLFASAETAAVGDSSADARAFLLIVTFVLGLALPVLPLTVSLVKIFSKKVSYPLPYYVMFAASAAWIVMSVVIIILTLI